VGIGGFAGALGGMGAAKFTGYMLDITGSYMLLFALAALAYPISLSLIQLLLPRHQP